SRPAATPSTPATPPTALRPAPPPDNATSRSEFPNVEKRRRPLTTPRGRGEAFPEPPSPTGTKGTPVMTRTTTPPTPRARPTAPDLAALAAPPSAAAHPCAVATEPPCSVATEPPPCGPYADVLRQLLADGFEPGRPAHLTDKTALADAEAFRQLACALCW